jgi:molybdenum-dependent DNA-binding transcriptional regulator ModE
MSMEKKEVTMTKNGGRGGGTEVTTTGKDIMKVEKKT